MTHKMPRAKSEFERGARGVGKIRFSKDGNNIQVVLNVGSEEKPEEKTFIVERENCPDYIEKARNAKSWMIQMSSEGDKLMNFYPATAVVIFRTKEFVAPEGKEPVLNTVEKEYKNKPYSYEKFVALFEIEEPEQLAGLIVPCSLRSTAGRPMFAPYQEGDKQYLMFGATGKYVDQLEEYLSVAGFFEDKYQPVEYTDNPLPTIQRIVLHEDRRFQANLKNGWIVPGSLIGKDDLLTAEDDEDLIFDKEEAEKAMERIDPKPQEFEDGEIDFEPENE